MKWLVMPAILVLALAVGAAGRCERCNLQGQQTRTPTPTISVPWAVDCKDEIRENGYLFGDACIPGAETYDASRFENPGYFSGAMSSYAEGIMEKVAGNRGYGLGGYSGGVALMGCGDIGKRAYIRRPGTSWDGPFLVVDCSSRWGVYHNIMVKGLAVEVDYQTAQRYGAGVLPWVDVRVEGNSGGMPGMSLAHWYGENVLAFEWRPSMTLPTPTAPALTQTPTPTVTQIPSRTSEPTDIPLIAAPSVKEPHRMADTFGGMLFLMLAGHALADFVFQTEKMGALKRPRSGPTWFYWLTAHALIHGAIVAIVTGSLLLGLAETVAHWLLDFWPGDRGARVHVDQWAHILLKVLWAAVAAWA